jgi:hypothetical protein
MSDPRLGDFIGRAYADFSRTPAGFQHPRAELATGAVFEPAHIAPHLAKSARTGNDNAALSVSQGFGADLYLLQTARRDFAPRQLHKRRSTD